MLSAAALPLPVVMKTQPWFPIWFLLLLGVAILALPGAEAGVRASANYSIDVETVDGGGRAVSSASYRQTPSVATVAIGTSTSTDYSVEHGFVPPLDLPDPHPTVARLAYFRAVRMRGGAVEVSWLTLFEGGVLGFCVERFVPGEGWERMGERIIAAEGHSLGRWYVLEDAAVVVGAQSGYRLIEIDLWGREHVVAESSTTPALEIQWVRDESGLTLRLAGQPGARIVVEAADRVQGPWRRMGVVTLDESGAQSLAFELGGARSVQFLRALHD